MTTNMPKLNKGECMKHMTVEVHPALLDAWYFADVKREVTAAGAKLSASEAVCDPALVLWARTMPPKGSGPNPLSTWESRCDRALYILPAYVAAPLVADRQLAATAMAACDVAAARVTVVILHAKDYFKSSGRRTQNKKKITEIELEMAIADLMVSTECDAAVVNTPNELALLIVRFTKAIAEWPIKKAKRELDEQAPFYMQGDNKKCIAMDNNGNGRARLWQQMIAVLPNSSLETSRAICAQYATPKALYEAAHRRNAIQELADIGVSRALVPNARTRRIGPEFARRLHTLFTADNGDELLD